MFQLEQMLYVHAKTESSSVEQHLANSHSILATAMHDWPAPVRGDFGQV